MQKEEDVYRLIDANLQDFVARGVARKPGDVEACLQYRQGLDAAGQELFDSLLRSGTFAGSAADLVELLNGREQPSGAKTLVGAATF